MALDLCMLDMAGHCHEGTYTASRGRTYAKDKTDTRESTFDTFKLLFDDTGLRPTGGAPTPAPTTSPARTRYRPPQVLIDIATGDDPGVVTRERHGIFVDGGAPITDDPEAPFGYDFDDPENLEFWWSQGALGMWQVIDVEPRRGRGVPDLRDRGDGARSVRSSPSTGATPTVSRSGCRENHAVVNFGHLREANTYSWRS